MRFFLDEKIKYFNLDILIDDDWYINFVEYNGYIIDNLILDNQNDYKLFLDVFLDYQFTDATFSYINIGGIEADLDLMLRKKKMEKLMKNIDRNSIFGPG